MLRAFVMHLFIYSTKNTIEKENEEAPDLFSFGIWFLPSYTIWLKWCAPFLLPNSVGYQVLWIGDKIASNQTIRNFSCIGKLDSCSFYDLEHLKEGETICSTVFIEYIPSWYIILSVLIQHLFIVSVSGGEKSSHSSGGGFFFRVLKDWN